MEEKKTENKKDLLRGTRTLKGNSKNRGITLIALVITILVILILARSYNCNSNRGQWIASKSTNCK